VKWSIRLSKKEILDNIKKYVILLSDAYDTNIKVELNINKKDQTLKTNITEYL
jgi:hypothetical protein